MSAAVSHYDLYARARVIDAIAAIAHGKAYCGQSSSVGPADVAAAVPPPSSHPRVLDLGCGRGAFSLLLASRGHHCHGVDLAAESIAAARRAAATHAARRRCHFEVNDFTALEAPAQPFDVLLAVGSLYAHAAAELQALFGQWRAQAGSGGAMVLFTNVAARSFPAHLARNLGGTTFPTAGGIEAALAGAGFARPQWQDTSAAYVQWLRRWQGAMRQRREALDAALGAGAKSFVARVDTYLELADAGHTRRYALRAVAC